MKDKLISEAIQLTVDSLVSHLPYTHGKLQLWAKKNGETHVFHKKCVKDYAKVISILVQLYEE